MNFRISKYIDNEITDFQRSMLGFTLGLVIMFVATNIFQVNDFDYLNIKGKTQFISVARILSIDGREVIIEKLALNQNQLIKINTSSLLSGNYVIELEDEYGRIIREKVIIAQ
mgnify:CR=1 FL=1